MVSLQEEYEFHWPQWAFAPCIALVVCLVLLHMGEKMFCKPKMSSSSCDNQISTTSIDSFRRQYLVVYFLVMFADWLQGTHMYALYESYNVNVSLLFVIGFLSSAQTSHFVGKMVDLYGRRKACLVFCALEIVINVLENIPRLEVLIFGRILGGISTSLLFSAFESWMVTEHRARGFPEEALAETFTVASEGNGLLAIIAGIVSQVSADAFGEVGPFRLAVIITIIAMVMIFPWNENFGVKSEVQNTKALQSEVQNTKALQKCSVVQLYGLGLCYSLFEGSMYVFVFLWYPTLFEIVPKNLLPSGLVFSVFMLSIAIGGKLFGMIGGTLVREELMAISICAVASTLLLIPTITGSYEIVFSAFLVFEMCVGIFSPCSATLRTRYFPNHSLSSTLCTFRLPTNLIVVLGVGGADYFTRDRLFQFSALMMVISALCGCSLLFHPKYTDLAQIRQQLNASKYKKT